jgi:hypothetical protein
MSSTEQIAAVERLASQLCSNHHIARVLHMSRATIAKILADFERPNCPCGRVVNHSGWCEIRTQSNAIRKAFLVQMGLDPGSRRRARRLAASGSGGVGVDAIVIKAPPKPIKPLAEDPPPPVEKKPFSMASMQGPNPFASVIKESRMQRNVGRV